MTRYNEPNNIPNELKGIKKRLSAVERSQIGPQLLTEKSDMRTPAAPQNLAVTSISEISKTGDVTGTVSASWDEVTEATFGTPLEISQYELWGRPAEEAVWRRLTASPETSGEYGPLPSGATWTFRVRAIARSSTSPGEFSNEVLISIAGDTTPPPVPSRPILNTAAGVIVVEWDGKGVSGEDMPADFSHIEVAVGDTATPVEVVSTLQGAGNTQLANQPYYEPRHFRFRSVDRSQNKSEWSTSRDIVAVPISFDAIDGLEETLEDFNKAVQRAEDAAVTAGNASELAEQSAEGAQTAADQAIQDALDAFNLANSKTKTTVGTSFPGTASVGDMFVNITSRESYVWDGDSWEPTSSPVDIDELVAGLSGNQEFMELIASELDGVIATYYGPQPTNPNEGDLWLDTTDPENHILKRYSGSAWVRFDNPRIQEAYETANEAVLSAEAAALLASKRAVVKYQDTAPEPDGDTLWFDTSDGNTPKVWVDLGPEPRENFADLSRISGGSGATVELHDDKVVEVTTLPTGTPYLRIGSTASTTPLVVGAEYTASVDMRSADGKTAECEVFIQWYGGSGYMFAEPGGPRVVVSPDEWTRVYSFGTAPEGAVYFNLWVDRVSPERDDVYLVRNVLFEEAPEPLPFFNGDTPGARWAGTPGDSLSIYDGPGWFEVSDAAIKQAQDTADSKISTYAQSAAPTGLTTIDSGDLWIDTDNNHLFRWNGTDWIEVIDPDASADRRIQAALTQGGLLSELQAQVDSAISTYYGSAAPTDANEGDLWLDSSDAANARLKRYNGSAWVLFENPLVQSTYEALEDTLLELDTKITTYAQDAAPTGLGTTDTGDLWIDTNDKNKLHRWSGTAWAEVRDESIEDALNLAGSKGRLIFATSAPTSPEDRQTQNMWIDTSLMADPNGGAQIPKNTPHRWTGSAWVAITDAAIVAAAKAAADAVEAAKVAHVAAGSAQKTADSAMSSANGKTAVLHSDDPPSGTGAPGDIWWQHGTGVGSGTIVGQWRWVGLPTHYVNNYNTTTPFVLAEPLGEGKVRFTALHDGPHTGWSVGGSSNLADGKTYTHTYSSIGDVWVRVASNDTVYQAPFTITSAMLGSGGSWVKEEVGSEAIANLDVGKLTAGSAEITDGVVERLWAEVVRSRKITTDMLLVGQKSNLLPDPRFEDPLLTEDRRKRSLATLVSDGMRVSGYSYFVGSSSYLDGQKYAIEVQPGEQYYISVPVIDGEIGMLHAERWAINGSRNLDSSNMSSVEYVGGILSGTYTVPAGATYFAPVLYKSGYYTVQPGAFVHRKIDSPLIVDGGIVAKHLNVQHTDVTTGHRMTLMPDGLRLWGENDLGEPTIKLTTDGAQNFALLDENDQIAAGIDSGGGVVGQEGSFETLNIAGNEFYSILNDLPRGVVYDRQFTQTRSFTTLGGHSYITFDVNKGRMYEVKCRMLIRNRDSMGAQISFTWTGASQGNTPLAPSSSGEPVRNTVPYPIAETRTTSAFTSRELTFTVSGDLWNEDRTLSILVAAEPFEATGAGRLEFDRAWWTVKDIGSTSGIQKGGNYSTSGGGSTGGTVAPAPEPVAQRHTKHYTSTSWSTFQNVTGSNTGSRTTAVSGPTQGRTPYYTSAGQYATHFYFDHGRIRSDLDGAEVISARVKIKCTHSHSGSGGTARLHTHGYGPSGNWGAPKHIGDKHFSRGQSHWLGVGSDEWRTGAYRGVGFFSDSTSTEYYMQFGTTAVLEIVYEK